MTRCALTGTHTGKKGTNTEILKRLKDSWTVTLLSTGTHNVTAGGFAADQTGRD